MPLPGRRKRTPWGKPNVKPVETTNQIQDQVNAIQKAYPGITDTPALKDQLRENAPADQPVPTKDIIAIGHVIEWSKGRFAGAIGHVLAIEPDGFICVQQPCNLPALRWFKVPKEEARIIGRAAGKYKIPQPDIRRQIEGLKPRVRTPDEVGEAR